MKPQKNKERDERKRMGKRERAERGEKTKTELIRKVGAENEIEREVQSNSG